jgi:hypothetical protein
VMCCDLFVPLEKRKSKLMLNLMLLEIHNLMRKVKIAQDRGKHWLGRLMSHVLLALIL